MTLNDIGYGLRLLGTSFLGTIGFAVLLHAPRRAWLPASVIGAMAYTLYWMLTKLGMSDPIAIFSATVLGSLAGQYCARRMRMIATVFMILSIVALVPGLGLYRCMAYLGQLEYSLSIQAGVQAMVGILMIALGLGVGAFLFRLIVGGGRSKTYPVLTDEEQ